jgi:hypothetical protein
MTRAPSTFRQQDVTSGQALGWTDRGPFGFAPLPHTPHPRYDEPDLIWLLRGRPVLALSEDSAVMENMTGTVSIYRRHNKPVPGPFGDSLDDFP